MACCCGETRKQTLIEANRREFELLDRLPDALAQMEQILIEYGTDGSGMINPSVTSSQLCTALTAWVKGLVARERANLELGGVFTGTLAANLAGAAGLIAFGFLTGGLGLALGLGIGATASLFGTVAIVDRVGYLADLANQKKAVCHLLEQIPYDNPNKAELEAALDSLPATNTGEEHVRDVLQRLGKVDKYGHYSLLQTIAEIYEYGYPDTDCGCDDTCVSYALNHNVSGGNVSFPSPLVVTGGAYNASYDDYSVIGGGNGALMLRWEFAQCRNINHIGITRWFNQTQLSDTRFSYNDGIAIANNNSSPFTVPTLFEWDGLLTGVNNLTIELTGTAGTYYIGWREVDIS